ncbi:hypothetical protein [Leptospira santarosai]|uniref:hypothetical protein n=1 Tax=Leptospira santarosai TaxID=28183 RepID=UPI0003540318|nr:hypothetical protein [Leptospira santarosai]EPG81309.1 hypothetical protein LEP1GSC048_0598 [Leptospira santarosai serovar Shermani str. 1342KT]
MQTPLCYAWCSAGFPLRSLTRGHHDLSSLRTIPLPSKIVVKDQKHFTLRTGGAVEIISPKFLVNLELYP